MEPLIFYDCYDMRRYKIITHHIQWIPIEKTVPHQHITDTSTPFATQTK
jgi:hypothetical protein